MPAVNQHNEDGHLPFASSFEGSVLVCSALAGSCIMRQPQRHLPPAEVHILETAGLKLKHSVTCIPDLIINTTKLAVPMAIMVAQDAAGVDAENMHSQVFLERCCSMANTFRLCYLMVPYSLAAHPTALQVASDSRYKGKIVVHYFTPSDGLANSIVQLIQDMGDCGSAEQQDALQEMYLAAATSSEGLMTCIGGLSSVDAHLSHQPAMPWQPEALVGVFGSLHELLHASIADMLACGCDESQAQRLWQLCNSAGT